MINYNKYELSKNEKVKFILLLLCGAGGIGYIFFESLLIGVVVPFLYRPGKKIYESILATRRKNKLRIQFRDLLYSLSASFAAGRHMEEALREARISLEEIYEKKEYILQEIGCMIQKIHEAGESDIDVLSDFAKRSGVDDIEDFTEVFRACRETGGNMVTSINKAATIIGEKITIEAEIKNMVSQKKFEGKIITAMPVIIIVFLKVMSPGYLSVMYETLAGKIMMGMALTVTGIAYYMIERITTIEV